MWLYRIVQKKIFHLEMSYRYYRLRLTTNWHTNEDTLCLRKTLTNLEVTFKDNKFSDADQILTFYNLLCWKTETMQIRKRRLMVLPPHLLTDSTGDQYSEFMNCSFSENIGGTVYWPEVNSSICCDSTPSNTTSAEQQTISPPFGR